jgi:hypothetical protein
MHSSIVIGKFNLFGCKPIHDIDLPIRRPIRDIIPYPVRS